jgi:aminocarboxymuconate-semialdehyde decarboxylase
MKVDVHSHFLPPEFMSALSPRKVAPRIVTAANGSALMDCGQGLTFPVTDRMTSIDLRLQEMKEAGIDRQVISLPMPGTDFFNRELARKLAAEANDELAETSRSGRGFLMAAATVPLRYPALAVEELRRAVNELGMHAVEVFSNVAGRTLDSREFLPFFKEAAHLGVPILVHPGRPIMMDSVQDYGLAGAVGFLFDTTLAILRLVYSGLLEKLPDLRIVIPHSGSTIPYLVGRIDHQYKLLPESQKTLSKPPSEYLKEVYIDTAQSFYRPAMECAISFTPHERILFGTDYPFADLKTSAASIEALHLPKEVENMIFAGNARALGIV